MGAPTAALIGRDAEQEAIGRLLDRAAAGEGGCLVVRGAPGTGKSALLEWVRRRAVGDVVGGQGIESETELPFSGLFEVLRGALQLLPALPDPQAAALRGAFALGPPWAGDRFAVYLATLGLLAARAEQGQLVVVVDDVQWLDTPSREALAFCARRLRDEPVAMILAAREDGGGGSTLADLPGLPLGPLDADDSRALLRRSAGGTVAHQVEERLLAACAGHPLALVEVPRLLTPAQLQGAEQLPDPLPSNDRLGAVWAAGLKRLSTPARMGLEVLAVSDSESLNVVARALELLGVPAEAMEEAEEAAMVEIAHGTAAFRHPLLRSVVLAATPGVRRRRAHMAIARTVGGERAAWHMAAAETGPSEEVASALEGAARAMLRRADPEGASRALARAAELTPARSRRVDRLLAAAGQAQLGLRSEAATALLERAVAEGADVRQRADAERLRGRILVGAGALDAAKQALIRGAEAVHADDPGRAATMLADAALVVLLTGRTVEGLRTARRALLVAGDSPSGHAAATASLGWALILRGDWRTGYPLVTGTASLRAPEDLTGTRDPVNLARECSIWVEDWQGAEQRLTALVASLRETGAVAALSYPLGVLADLEFRTGRWSAALAHAGEAVALGHETGQWPGPAAAALARIQAARGDEADCRRNVAELLGAARALGFRSLEGYATAALGLLELGLGNAAEATVLLRTAGDVAVWGGMAEPWLVPWQPDLIEARVRAGDAAGARRAVRAFAQQASRIGRPVPSALLARCRGLIAPDNDFDRHFGEALQALASSPVPFERARTWLVYGERLRRARRRAEARRRLGEALETFTTLGAGPWADRARAELRAAGARTRTPAVEDGATPELTPQELTVAQAVAEGATNREVAARLFVSPRTVEGHLGNVYRKLGVRSRTELARLMVARGTGQGISRVPTSPARS